MSTELSRYHHTSSGASRTNPKIRASKTLHVIFSTLIATICLFIPFAPSNNKRVHAASSLTVCSVTTDRGVLAPGDGGYTLNGAYMSPARSKLLNTANFGAGGTIGISLNIVDAFGASDSITSNSLKPCNVFFLGSFADGLFSNAELDALYNWSLQTNKLVVLTGQPPYGVAPISRWGYQLSVGNNNPTTPTSTGITHPFFSGPYGAVSSVNQGGTAQGYFSIVAGSTVLGQNAIGNATILLDNMTNDIIIADTDFFTTLGDMSSGNGISSSADRLWCNIFAFTVTETLLNKKIYLPLTRR